MEFIDHLTKFQVTSYAGIEDFGDKLNFQFTVIILLFCTLLITVKQYVFKPISCYISTDQMGRNLLSFVENYCWVQGTIPIKEGIKLPVNEKQWELLENEKILYYQWVPFALGLQCIFFYLPRLIWQITCYNQLGTDIQHLITNASQAVHSSGEEPCAKLVAYVARTIAHTCYQHREYRESSPKDVIRSLCPAIRNKNIKIPIISKRSGTRTIFLYLFHKVLYLINSCLQLYFMHQFLGSSSLNNHKNALNVLISSIYYGRIWKETLLFPRKGYCYVPIRLSGQTNYVTSQCVLPVNMLNERIYLFLYFWIILCITINVLSIPLWFWRIFVQQNQLIIRFLKLKDVLKKDEEYDMPGTPLTPGTLGNHASTNINYSIIHLIKIFQNKFLRKDGLFIIYMITINCGDVISADIVLQLWKIFKSTYYPRMFRHKSNSTSSNSKSPLRNTSNGIIPNSAEPTSPSFFL